MAFLLYHNFIKYMPRTNEINNGMNNSSALVALQRSEIRTVVNAAFSAVVNFYCKHTLTLTFLLITFISACHVLEVQRPWYAALALTIVGSCSILRSLLVILIGMKDCPRDMQ